MKGRNTQLFTQKGLNLGYSVKSFSFILGPRFDGMEALVTILP